MGLMLPLFAFMFGSALVAAAAYAMMPSRAGAIDRRLDELTLGRQDAVEEKPRFRSVVGMLKRLGEKAPRSPREMGNLRLRLVRAGFRRDEALTMFFGIRVLFALGLFMAFSTSLIARPNLTLALGGLGLGYILPGMVLARLAKRRAHRIRLSLADMLDLLVVSVEAGLGLDAALTRVGQELAFAYPELADELRLINLELRAGKGRVDALRNLATERVRYLCAQLVPDQRDVILLRVVADLTVDQVAQVLGKTPGAVKALQRRGFEALRRVIERQGVPL